MIALLLALVLAQETIKADKDCMGCHVKQTQEWKTSVHAKHETTCISCHKESVIDRSLLPGNPHLKQKPFIAGNNNRSQDVCVQCHVKETEEFKNGPHWVERINPKLKWQDKKRQGCLTCHEPHGTTIAERKAIYDQRCTHCHEQDAIQRTLFISYMAANDPFDAELAALKKLLEHPLPGVPYEKAEIARDSAQDLHRTLRMLQHNCEFKELEKKIEPALKPLKEASTAQQAKVEAAGKSRRNYFLGFLALMVVNLFLLRASCVKKYSGGARH
jgi:hypothetical protein